MNYYEKKLSGGKIKTLFLIVSVLIGLSAFTTAHAKSCTEETIVGEWRETGIIRLHGNSRMTAQ